MQAARASFIARTSSSVAPITSAGPPGAAGVLPPAHSSLARAIPPGGPRVAGKERRFGPFPPPGGEERAPRGGQADRAAEARHYACEADEEALHRQRRAVELAQR